MSNEVGFDVMGFVCDVKVELSKRREDITVQYQCVHKNNEVLTGLAIFGEKICMCHPIVYFNSTNTVEAIVERIISVYDETPSVRFDPKELSKEDILAKIYPCVVSVENDLFLNNHPFRELCDLAIYYRYPVEIVGEDDGIASFIITNDVCERYDISEEELHNASIAKMDASYSVASLSELLHIDDEDTCDELDFGMLVVSNATRHQGASAFLSDKAMCEVLERLHTDCVYILPSSIHEVLCVDARRHNLEELRNLVSIVNDTEVDPKDRLTYSVYSYSMDDGIRKVA